MSRSDRVRDDLEAFFRAALRAVDPAAAVRRAVQSDGALCIAGRPVAEGARIYALAVGKAAGAMAGALEQRLGSRFAAGLAVVPDGAPLPPLSPRFAVRRTAHPVPDSRSERAGRAAIALVESVGPGDLLVAMISGGASSLLSCPTDAVSIDELAQTTACLLDGGAGIDELNAVRKHLSRVAGGRLATHLRCKRVEQLLISDVPGDRVDVIGSGPLAGDPSTYADALDVLAQRADPARVPMRVRAHLEAGARGELAETPGPDSEPLRAVATTLLANNDTALRAAAEAASRAGYRSLALSGALRGPAAEAGTRLVALGGAIYSADPVCAIAGGETTVEVHGAGRGGRNQELALAAAIAIDGRDGLAVLAVGTDGIDGPTDAAGAFADGGTLARARSRHLDPVAALAANDSHTFFEREGGVVRTGATGTNVMDLAFLHVAAGR